jgi:3-methylcrotonyl-CoA carboxylase alpha subunit
MHLLWQAHDDSATHRAGYSPWGVQDAFQLGASRRQKLTVLADGVGTPVEVEWKPDGPAITLQGESTGSDPSLERGEARGGPARGLTPAAAPIRRISVAGEDPLYVLYDMHQIALTWPTFDAGAIEDNGDGASVRAPIIGRVAKVFVKPGDTVAKGDCIAVVEAMKMEHVLHAARAGKITKVAVAENQQVTQGALVAALE